MRSGILALIAGSGMLLPAAGATATVVPLVSGNATYQVDNAQPGFTTFSASANNGIDFDPNVNNFIVSGNTAFAFLDFQVFGNPAGGGNVFAFDDFSFTLSGSITPLPGQANITLNGTVDVIAASQGGSNLGNPGLPDVSVLDSKSLVSGPWSSTLSWNIFDDFLDGTAYDTAVATGLDFSLVVSITAINGATISQITDGMSNVGVSVQAGVAVPEPSTGLLLLMGLVGVGCARRSRRRAA